MKKLILFLLLINHFSIAQSVKLSQTHYQKALQYFAEAQQASAKDAGKLWGRSLYGAMLFIKLPERLLVANQPDLEGYLKPQGKLYVGRLPKDMGIANTARQWKGKRWTMVIWYKFNPVYHISLFMHELFHRVQPKFGVVGNINNHLDDKEARILLQLEWNALLAAYNKSATIGYDKKAVRQAVKAALTFRQYRQSLYPYSKQNENALEMHEGLAEYTGQRLGGMNKSQLRQYIRQSVKRSRQRKSFVRSFAYISGPLYGFLLDMYAPHWRTQLATQPNFGVLLGQALDIRLKAGQLKTQVGELGKQYNEEHIRNYENKRARKKAALLRGYTATLIRGKVLTIPLKGANYTFNPNNLVPLDKQGTVYPNFQAKGIWGMLKVKKGGVLMSADYKRLVVPCNIKVNPLNKTIETADWMLKFNKGWQLKPGKRAGDWELIESKKKNASDKK